MLFRFREAQAADLGIIDAGRARRPKLITEVESVPVCEKWRGQVLKDISRKVSRIHDPVLSDYQIRDLNDDINKLMREKHMWEVQIRNLGGPNYMRAGARLYDEQGREVPGRGKGYKYFGRAKELPGVRELFEAAKAKSQRREGAAAAAAAAADEGREARRIVDAAYYGFAPGEEDEAMLAYEADKERLAAENLARNGPQGETKAPHKRNRVDQNTLGEGQYFGHNFSRPQLPTSDTCPATPNSAQGSSNWRSVFKNRAVTSSLVDLEPPKRRPSVGSLRHVSSDLHLGPVAALPAALGGSGIRPGNPNRPAASRNAEWVNPLDVHFGKDQTSQRPGPAAAVAATVPAVAVTPPSNVGQTDGAHGRVEPSKPTTATAAAAAAAAAATASGYPAPSHAQNSAEETVILNGHPSPPASHRYSDAAASSSLNDDTSGIYPSAGEFKANASGALTQSDVPEMEPLPSPATSVRGTSEERTEGPVVRNVPVRRDTLAFHQPRRPSCALEFEEGHRRATTMHLSTERFSGNFADFDFGETVTKTASNTTVGEETTCLEHVMTSRLSRGSSNDGQVKPNKRLSSWSVSGPHAGEREGSASPAPTQASEDQTSNSALIDQLPQPPGESARFRPRQGFQSRFASSIGYACAADTESRVRELWREPGPLHANFSHGAYAQPDIAIVRDEPVRLEQQHIRAGQWPRAPRLSSNGGRISID
ncbi:hypothetical protein UVI_02059180 [Ustilaginoidea virens]|uniref:Pre-mRNA-splicing factor ISY1 n=1 Tax=Ustilaginoidea virens TaxID=1159556 RepID=A0A1B5L823_USTVR|nr:hypothetical protein UVI_02059180 [Ustilaginoidea virens]